MLINKIAIYVTTFAFIFASGALAAGMAGKDSQAMRTGFDQNFRASELIGDNMRSASGDDLGKIDDLVIGTDGEVQYLMVSKEGGGLIPVPFESTEFSFEKDAVVAHNLDRTILDGAPTLSSGEWNRLSDPSFEQNVRSYYDQSSVSAYAPSAEISGEGASFDRTYRASELMNKDIHNTKGEKIGEVNDLVIDESGQVKQIVVGGISGLAVPFNGSDFTIQEDAIVASKLDREILGPSVSEWRSEDGRVRSYYDEGAAAAPGRILVDDAEPQGYPLDRHPQLDVWFPPAGHPPYGAAD